MVTDVYRQMEGRALRLMTSNAYPAYKDAIPQVYGIEVATTPMGATASG